jgi:hypothetical protein
MKYRKLRLDELEVLEKEFIAFLASNQVTADEWQTFKKLDPEKADGLIGLFSDMVFDQTLDQVEYLEYKEPHDIKTFHCLEDKLVMMGMIVEGETSIDFTKEQTAEEMMASLQQAGGRLKLYRAEKTYKRERKAELFRMMESGCKISPDGYMFKMLDGLKSK